MDGSSNVLCNRPDFLCVGMQKAGTQWLYEQLNNVEGVWMPPIKEISYFSDLQFKKSNMNKLSRLRALAVQNKDNFTQRDADWLDIFGSGVPDKADDAWYLSLFAEKAGVLSGDISPSYSTISEEKLIHMAKLLPDTKIVILVRHPVERIKSALSMHVRQGKRPEKLLSSWPSLRRKLAQATYQDRSYPSKIWRKWSSAFGEDRCRYWFFEDIVGDPERVRSEISDFLGVKQPVFSIAANHNSKVARQKFPVSPEVEKRLHTMFHEEISACAHVFGSYANEW